MKKILLVVCLLVLGSAAFASPFDGREVAQPNRFQQVIGQVNDMQQDIKQTMSGHVRDFKDGGHPAALLLVFALAFAYGVVHAAGPGHGKSLVLAYLLNRPEGYARGVLMGALAAFCHGLSAIIVVLVIYLFSLGRLTTGFDAASDRLVLVSYSLIVLIGLALLVRWFRDPDAGTPGSRIPMIVAIGLVPCPGTMIVLLFFIAMQLLGLGIAVALVMAFGMSLTVALIALLAVGGRNLAVSRGGERIARGVELVGALLVMGLGSLLFISQVMG